MNVSHSAARRHRQSDSPALKSLSQPGPAQTFYLMLPLFCPGRTSGLGFTADHRALITWSPHLSVSKLPGSSQQAIASLSTIWPRHNNQQTTGFVAALKRKGSAGLGQETSMGWWAGRAIVKMETLRHCPEKQRWPRGSGLTLYRGQWRWRQTFFLFLFFL